MLQDSDMNVNDVISKIKHWANVEMFYISLNERSVVDRFVELESHLVKLYEAILEFEVEVFRWCELGAVGTSSSASCDICISNRIAAQIALSTERKERWKLMASKIEICHDSC